MLFSLRENILGVFGATLMWGVVWLGALLVDRSLGAETLSQSHLVLSVITGGAAVLGTTINMAIRRGLVPDYSGGIIDHWNIGIKALGVALVSGVVVFSLMMIFLTYPETTGLLAGDRLVQIFPTDADIYDRAGGVIALLVFVGIHLNSVLFNDITEYDYTLDPEAAV